MIQEKRVTGRFISLWGLCLLCLCTVFCLLADMPVEATETSGDWEYNISEDGTVEITDYKGGGDGDSDSGNDRGEKCDKNRD